MHEFALARSIHGIALEEAQRHVASRVLAVTLQVGVLREIVPSLLRSAFELISHGTPLAGAVLRMELEPVRLDCAACGRVTVSAELAACCPDCGSTQIRFSGGMDMQVTSMSICEKETIHEHPGASQCA